MAEQKQETYLSQIGNGPATDAEIEDYAWGIVTGVMEFATPNVVASLLTRIRDDVGIKRDLLVAAKASLVAFNTTFSELDGTHSRARRLLESAITKAEKE